MEGECVSVCVCGGGGVEGDQEHAYQLICILWFVSSSHPEK